jgi:thiol:disulfide interchange protein DsbD
MKYFSTLSLILFLISFSFATYAQDSSIIKFSYNQQRLNDKEVALIITAKVAKPNVKLLALQKNADDAVYSKIDFDSAAIKYLEDSITQKGNIATETDTDLQSKIYFVSDSVQWMQIINIRAEDSAVIKGKINYLYKNGSELPFAEEAFRFVITPKENDASAQNTGGTNGKSGKKNSLLWLFLLSFGGGLLALLTPCIYSMIPVTVSFFTKRSKTPKEGIRNALYYSLSIILIFTIIGTVISSVFGGAALYNVATNWIANLFFFLLFVLFGVSFLGAFEIELPSSWATKADSKASTKNFGGIFFMALTLVIVSFSCTAPIVGLLAVKVSQGNLIEPIIGFFAFSLALSLPFAFFAFFPSKLNTLGKAGGWLNAIKVTLGFLELALALKFLSNADQTMNWRILDREVFLALWIVIFLLLGFYLLGKLKFRHDGELPKNDFGIPFLSVTRLFFAIASLTFAVYMIPGLWGAPLKVLSAFLPPMGTQDFSTGNNRHAANTITLQNAVSYNDSSALPRPVKYVDVMEAKEPPVVVEYGLVTYFDYAEALEIARKVKKPLMIDFTGVTCVNCREMEGQVWSDPEVMKRLKNNFVIASLYVDVHRGVDLPISEQYYSEALRKHVEDLGERNTDISISKFGVHSQPYYFFLDANEQRLAPEGYGHDLSVSNFIKHLDGVIVEYKKRSITN